jgi:hypothetical protein
MPTGRVRTSHGSCASTGFSHAAIWIGADPGRVRFLRKDVQGVSPISGTFAERVERRLATSNLSGCGATRWMLHPVGNPACVDAARWTVFIPVVRVGEDLVSP